MVEPVNDNILNLVNELYNNLDAKDKIINEQVLEIANLNKRLENEQKVAEEYLRLEDDYEILYNENEHLKEEIARLKEEIDRAIKKLFNLKDMVYKPETREINFDIQREISTIIKILALGDKENE